MIDAPGREKARFPADKEDIAARAIAAAMDELGVNSADLAICSGACGGDLLFAEAALARKARLELYIPFEEATFIEKSVDFAGDDWRVRFLAAKSQAELHTVPLEHKIRNDADPYEEVNLWMLERAERFGADKVEFICLWNGQEGDGPGGTRHMMNELKKKGGQTHWLDTTKLWR
ncbi:hypothetical protein [Methylosinus sp. LW4]|uniref:hypothetical protein n=1 Tax=Methylosinus sp. LW4 TaxID=136993 RepID=UPI0018DEEC7A|nr:hypothetical protein [Methylosinus sp. LW4]